MELPTLPHLALLANITYTWRAQRSSLFCRTDRDKEKSFITLASVRAVPATGKLLFFMPSHSASKYCLNLMYVVCI
jgi:hypothetical protein